MRLFGPDPLFPSALVLLLVVAAASCQPPHAIAADLPAAAEQRETGLSRAALEAYLARAITMGELLEGRGDFDDNLRMLEETGARLAGRAIYVWGHEQRLPRLLEEARRRAHQAHARLPDLVLQAAAFEIVTESVAELPIPADVFETWGEPPQPRTFRYEEMIYPDGWGRDRWWRGASVPDIARPETRRWFYFLATRYLDAGCEAIHFGQAEIMARNDRDHRHWHELLRRVRAYAAEHARRGFVLCDAHVPSGGMLHGEMLLFDFHSMPLRLVEVPDRPQHAWLSTTYYGDVLYGRSRGGVAPAGWRCESLPYLVELDNWGVGPRPGQPYNGGAWVWGYDEISWFARQPLDYRNQWLRDAWRWVRQTDSNGYLQMPGSRVLHAPVGDLWWYHANRPSDAAPHGFDQEATIKAIWEEDAR